MAIMNKTRQELTEMFAEALKENRIPWRAVWTKIQPMNPVSHVTYRGVNNLMLNYVAEKRGYSDPRWCTYKQANDKGWQVKRGEKAARVEYWSPYDPDLKKTISWEEAHRIEREDPKRYKTLQLRCYLSAVFNAEQITGIPAYERPKETDIGTIRGQRDTLLRNMNLQYTEGGNQAYYSPKTDTVTLPPEASFDSVYGYVCTFLHECGHATGHESRLNRELSFDRDSPDYAREELRAEIASAFTSQELGIVMPEADLDSYLDHHKAYIQSWASALANNPDELFAAIKDANKISDYLVNAGEFTRERENAPAETKPLVEDLRPGYSLSLRELPTGGLRLTVEGTGEVTEFQENEALKKYLDQIREIRIGEGITEVGKRVFWRLPELTKVELPRSLEAIRYCGFDACPKLREIQYSGTTKEWDNVFKSYGSLPEQFKRELEIAAQTRLNQPAERGADEMPGEEPGGIVMVAEVGAVIEETKEKEEEQEAPETEEQAVEQAKEAMEEAVNEAAEYDFEM